jgi:hypothetical protein
VARSRFFVRVCSCLAAALLAGPALAVQPSEKLLPATTKGYISTHDVDEVRKQFQETDLGKLVHDPLMKPFIEDFKKQIGAKLEKAGKKLGLKWDDMAGVYGGEVALALVQPNPKDKLSHATVLIVDVTGKDEQVKALLAKVDANQRANRAVKGTVKVGDVTLTSYTQPPRPIEKGEKAVPPPEVSYYFIANNQLVLTDHLGVAREIVGRLNGAAKDTLQSIEAFTYSMQQNEKAANGTPQHVRWFVEPLGYLETARAAEGGRKKRGTDPLKILRGEGFDAIQGLGGYVFFNTAGRDITHRTYVYAPPVKRPAGAEAKDKYDLSMRMLDFPNSAAGTLEPQAWAMSDVATYITFNWKMKEAFYFSETLVDAIINDKGAWKEIWAGMKQDEYGPKIDIFKELVDHLGTRATLLADVTVPVGLKSERLLALVEVKDPALIARTIEKAFKADPSAKKRIFMGQVIWELTEEEIAGGDTELMIEGAGFVSTPEVKKDEDEEKKVLPNMAITVFQGHLVVGTHLDFVQDLIRRAAGKPNLEDAADYKLIKQHLIDLGSKDDSLKAFSRSDESYRATYELIKQGKLPEAETLLARILNEMLGPTEEGVVREQEIDGKLLPDFEKVKKYLGPGGLFVQTEDNGWWVAGCVLKKEAPAAAAAGGESASPTE